MAGTIYVNPNDLDFAFEQETMVALIDNQRPTARDISPDYVFDGDEDAAKDELERNMPLRRPMPDFEAVFVADESERLAALDALRDMGLEAFVNADGYLEYAI